MSAGNRTASCTDSFYWLLRSSSFLWKHMMIMCCLIAVAEPVFNSEPPINYLSCLKMMQSFFKCEMFLQNICLLQLKLYFMCSSVLILFTSWLCNACSQWIFQCLNGITWNLHHLLLTQEFEINWQLYVKKMFSVFFSPFSLK